MVYKNILLASVIVTALLSVLLLCLERGGVQATVPPEVLLSNTTTTPTPSPMIPKQIQALDRLLNIDDDCLSPCWWGFTLGETPPIEWYAFLEGEFMEEMRHDSSASGQVVSVLALDTLDLLDFITDAAFQLTQQDEMITRLRIVLTGSNRSQSGVNEYPQGYSIVEVIESYGHPTEVWIDPTLFNLQVILVYEEHRLLVAYEIRPLPADVIDEENELVNICPQIENLFFFRIDAYSQNDASPPNFPYLENRKSELQRISEVTSFSPETLAEAFLEDPMFCIEVPTEIVPSQP